MRNVFGKTVLTSDEVKIFAGCALTAILIAVCDQFRLLGVSLGLLYAVPLVVMALFVPAWVVVLLAIVASCLKEQFGPTPWNGDALERIAMSLLAFSGAGLFVTETVRRRSIES